MFHEQEHPIASLWTRDDPDNMKTGVNPQMNPCYLQFVAELGHRPVFKATICVNFHHNIIDLAPSRNPSLGPDLA
ncbi:hypothetical protein [Roseibium marinum]|uniref:Uncharacterized protein n=1 Tax=Roseibium marinum TaxID=281252 RepID=A0A2S3UXC3_9HYPH|nr:hypothetical protein [Roseibium marinum]POF32336.1 hypothetical protein CLV41_103259 [Roseibium marinum]